MANDTICINDDCPLQDRCCRHQSNWDETLGVDYWKSYKGEDFAHYYPNLHTGDCDMFAAKDSRVHCSMLKTREAKKLVESGLEALSVANGKMLRAKNRANKLERDLAKRKQRQRMKDLSHARLSKAREVHLNSGS